MIENRLNFDFVRNIINLNSLKTKIMRKSTLSDFYQEPGQTEFQQTEEDD